MSRLAKQDQAALRGLYELLEGQTLVLDNTPAGRALWAEVSEQYLELGSGEAPEVDGADVLDHLLEKYVEGWTT